MFSFIDWKQFLCATFFTAPVAVGYVPTTTTFEIKVANIPESLIPEFENKSCHVSTKFNKYPLAATWFRENLIMPIEWTLEHPHDVPPNASNKFEDQLQSFARFGYKAWNIENMQQATSYIKVTSMADNSCISIAGRADYPITRESVTVADYLSRILCVIEIQSKHGDRTTELANSKSKCTSSFLWIRRISQQ